MEKRAVRGTKNEKVRNTFRILDGKPQENGHFRDLGHKRKIILIICLGELRCDINSNGLATNRNPHIWHWRSR